MLSKRKPPTATLEVVTVEQAKHWLEDKGRRQNRPIDKITAERYKKGMLAGEWRIITGEPFIIDWDGHLINAQHRCWAIIESGIPLTTFVVRGVNPDAIYRVDIGKKRTGAHTLAMDEVPSYAVVASVIRSIFCVLNENSRFAVENYIIQEINEKYPSIGDMARKWRQQINPRIYKSWLPAVGWIHTQAGQGKVEEEMFAFFKHGKIPEAYIKDYGGNGYPGFALKEAWTNKKLEATDKMYLSILAYYEAAEGLQAPKIYIKPRTHRFGLVPEITL